MSKIRIRSFRTSYTEKNSTQ
uniref:Uncharacterized protein n=1 Tax=Arundo donax TaxID=35708 RepID=A0A0A9HS62_ARUDO